MYKQISEAKFDKLLKEDKSRITYNDWLVKYKGKTVHEIDVIEHSKWSTQYQSWKQGNVEKI
jgi:hypothetical protein|tara:strand:+ start:367 stop:552 length:186 start_codon:yes stop_codon:yes gene_type:complete